MELKSVQPRLSPFDEARQTLDQWEKEYPDTEAIVLVISAADDICVDATSGMARVSDCVGLLHSAAFIIMEN